MAESKKDEQPPQPQSQGDIIASAIANMLREQLAPITTLTQEVASIKSFLTTYGDRLAAVEESTRSIPRLRYQMDAAFTLEEPFDLASASYQDYYEHRLRDIDTELSGFSSMEVEDSADVDMDKLFYDMSGKKILVIFNHEVFENNLGRRHGTEFDALTLQQLFRDLNFEVEVHNDLKLAALWDVLIRLQEQDHRETACLFFAFLTHGDTGGILSAADDKYEFKSVIAMFENHSSLVNKPKVFLVQACRGHDIDFGTEVADNKDDDDDTDFTFVTPSHADFLVMHSTVEESVSFRDTRSGSWMIQTLCAVIKEYYRELDFVRMATLIHKKVAYDFQVPSYGKQAGFMKQVPETTFTFTKRLQI